MEEETEAIENLNDLISEKREWLILNLNEENTPSLAPLRTASFLQIIHSFLELYQRRKTRAHSRWTDFSRLAVPVPRFAVFHLHSARRRVYELEERKWAIYVKSEQQTREYVRRRCSWNCEIRRACSTYHEHHWIWELSSYRPIYLPYWLIRLRKRYNRYQSASSGVEF